jgi:GT2 family glycosyltransferase
MSRLGAVVVTWNSEAEIGACLDALLRWADEVVVVDNASADGTEGEVRRRGRAGWIGNRINRGFGAAANQGIRALETPLVLLVNPDTVLLDSPAPLVAACEAPGVGAAAGRLIGPDGQPQRGFAIRRFPSPAALAFEVLALNRLWPGNPINRRYRCQDFDWSRPAEIEQPAGAFLLLRRAAWEKVNGFDEGFHPIWFEDVDFLKRLREGGWRVVYRPECRARHVGAASIGRISQEDREVCWYSSLLRYAAKHYGPGAFRAVCASVVAGSVLRMVAGIARERSGGPVRVFGRVAGLAWRQFLYRRQPHAAGPAERLRQRAEQEKVQAPVS